MSNDDLIMFSLRESLGKPGLLRTGIYTPTAPEDLIMFYTGKDVPERIDLANASLPQLLQLLSSCKPLDEKDILGEAFRKAGKLGEFLTRFDPVQSGILHVASKDLKNADVQVELDGFYVYGKGSSVKIQSTERGTIVVVFPTVYEGDKLIAQKGNEKWSFDPSKALSDTSKPSVAFASCGPGIDLEVQAVKSGHLTMLVYRMVKKKSKEHAGIQLTPNEAECKFKTALSTALADSEFLPKGGFLGFGLAHKYPGVVKDDSIRGLKKKLEGHDNLVWHVCRELSLKVSLRVVYNTHDGSVMTKRPADLSSWCGAAMDESIQNALMYDGGEAIIDHNGGNGDDDDDYEDVEGDSNDDYEDVEGILVRWVVPPTENAVVATSYSGYGHKASISWLRGKVCLLVRVPDVGIRVGGEAQKEDSSSDESEKDEFELEEDGDGENGSEDGKTEEDEYESDRDEDEDNEADGKEK